MENGLETVFFLHFSMVSIQFNIILDLAKPKSGAPWLFIVTACGVCENKRFRIVHVLMFLVAALIIKSFSLLSSMKNSLPN